MGLNEGLIGKKYPETRFQVSREAMTAYARATNEDNPVLAGPEASMASPMFAVVWLAEPMMQCLFDAELIADANIGRMVHGGQDMHFVRPVRPGERLFSSSQVAGIESKSTGQILDIGMQSRDEQGAEVLRASASFFFRAPPDPDRPKAARPSEPELGEPVLVARITTAADQTHRYAEASGDRNPIHTDDSTARMMGFDGIILHGLCTMALAQKALIDGALHARPERLRRLKVQFARPVYPRQGLELRAWNLEDVEGGGRLAFSMHSDEGQVVLRDGLAAFDRA